MLQRSMGVFLNKSLFGASGFCCIAAKKSINQTKGALSG